MSAPRSDTSESLQVEVNGEARTVPSPCTVENLLSELSLKGKRVAVAVNREVVFRARYPQVEIADGDQIEILEAVGGG